jgi:hypothetical protein
VTLQPNHSDLSSPVTTEGTTTPARQITEPIREIVALALLAVNAVLLLLGVVDLLLVFSGWASDFGLRSEATFGRFVGPLALGLPIAALLVGTHVAPMVPRTRLVVLGALSEYGVSAVFGAITFLGAFAYDLRSVRATLEGLLERGVWLGLLVVLGSVILRVWLGLFPPPKPRPVSYPRYSEPMYGMPYPGQPTYPQTTYRPGSQPVYSPGPVAPVSDGASGWPSIPPPPMPTPVVVEPDPTMRLHVPTQELPTAGEPASVEPVTAAPAADAGADATQVVPAPADNGADATQGVPAPAEPDPTRQPSQ